MQRIHVNNSTELLAHFAKEKTACPSCNVGPGLYCLDTGDNAKYNLPINTVHLSRVKAFGFNVY